ncbi:MAG: tRNA pseudouridine synthase [Acidobacteria bacterium]|nr:tRNA pseudouridine synthase [Acidobacteriota bacterium]
MPRYRLDIEYQGTRYSGWQIQKNARTIQGEIAAAIQKLTLEKDFELYGAGRTDAGVHALMQTAHLQLRSSLPAEKLWRLINDELPPDINILRVTRADPRFHARHHAVARAYLYQISRRRTAFGKKLVWWIKDPLDTVLMRAAAALFTGMRDWQAFTDDDPEKKSTLVMVERIEIREAGHLILIRVVGSHFLWKMVRRLVGILAEVGRGALAVKDVPVLLQAGSGEPARFTAPPSGLFLERVYYPGEDQVKTLEPVLPVPRALSHE